MSSSAGPFQKGEVKVFRLASGITPQGNHEQFEAMDAPSGRNRALWLIFITF